MRVYLSSIGRKPSYPFFFSSFPRHRMPVFFPLYGEVRSSLLRFNPATISRPLRTSTSRPFRMSIPRHSMPAFISSIPPFDGSRWSSLSRSNILHIYIRPTKEPRATHQNPIRCTFCLTGRINREHHALRTLPIDKKRPTKSEVTPKSWTDY